ncbi:MAG: ABC transporter permease [Nitrospirota bacterium]
MQEMTSSLVRAFELLISLDPVLYGIIFLSLQVSGLAVIAAAALGVPAGAGLALVRFPGREAVVSLLNTFMGLPPVVVGLVVYLILSRSGPMGFLGFLYSPTAMIAAQTVLAFPIVAALTHAGIASVDPIVKDAIRSLGATTSQAARLIVSEARYAILAAVIAGYGRAAAEVGAVLMVGGNVEGYTRVMTTAIALETSRGDFELALALGIVLLFLSLVVNLALRAVQKRGALLR